MNGRRKDNTGWSEYLENDRREQKQLADAQTVIEDAARNVTRWLLNNPSALDSPSTAPARQVFALQDRLAELGTIVARRIRQDYSPKDGRRWSPTRAEVLRLWEKIGQPTDNITARLPKELPGIGAEPNLAAKRDNPLTKREEKLWAVIQRGLKGAQYAREVKNAGIGLPRKGIFKVDDAPRDYVTAYQRGGSWRHWIQDEKSEITRKARLAGLASE